MSSDEKRDSDSRSDCSREHLPLGRRDYLQYTGVLAGTSFLGSVAAMGDVRASQGATPLTDFDPDRFADPPASSRPTILWFWGGTMSEERISRQLTHMREVGVQDVVIFPRENDSPMRPVFFSEEWFDRVGFAIEESKQNDMTVWLFNDNFFPSGRAGGFVVEGGQVGDRTIEPHPELRQQHLRRDSERVSGPGSIDVREVAGNRLPSGLSIENDALLVEGSENPPADVALLNRGFDWTNYRFSFDTRPLETGEGNGFTFAQAGWAFRAEDSNNAYVWLLGNYPHSGAEGGNLTKIAYDGGDRLYVTIEPLPFDIRSGEWYHVETTVEGNEIVTTIEGQRVDMTTDDVLDSGTIGFREADTESALFDNVIVETLSGETLFQSSFDDESALDVFEESIPPEQVVAVAGLPLADGDVQLESPVDLTTHFVEDRPWDAPDGEYLLEAYSREFTAGNYLDLMSERAVELFVDVIHGEYYRRFDNEFGDAVRGFWDDEPHLGGQVPWSPSLPSELNSLGHSLVDVLPVVYREVDEPGRTRRETYWHAVENRLADAYFGIQGEWAEKHDVDMISNPWDHSGPSELVSSTGDLAKDNQWFQVPGMDAVWDQVVPGGNLIAPRYASSPAHQMGRPRVLSENLGAYGWDVMPEMARFVNGYMALRGANLTVLHAYWSNQDLVHDPPPIQPLNTWWFAMDGLVEWTGRLMEANRGEVVMETALVVPQRAAEAYQDTETADAIDSGFLQSTFALEDEQVDFDFLGESWLDGDPEMQKQASVHDGELELGPQSYRVIVLPPTPLVSLETIRRLQRLVRGGGVVVAVGRLPTEEAEGRDQKLQQALADLFSVDPTNPTERTQSVGSGTAAFAGDTARMQTIVSNTDAPAVSLPSIDGVEDITVLRRTRGDERVFLLMNEGTEPFETEATFPVSGVPEIWNPEDGSTRTATQFHAVDGGTAVPLRFDPFEVIAVVFQSSNGGDRKREDDDDKPGRGPPENDNNEESAPEPSQVPHIIDSDLPVTAVEQIDAQTLSATVRAESTGTHHLTGRQGGRIYDGTVDIVGSFDPVKVTGSWRFRFERDGAAWREVSLGSWTDLDADFSGTGIYETTFSLSEAELSDRQLRLDLGRVRDVAEVILNGEQVATLTVRPYQVDITDALQAGENHLRVRVTNTNANEHGQSLPSGLFGPVQLDPFKFVRTNLTLEPGGRATDLSIDASNLTLFPGQESTVTVTATNLLRRPVRDTLTATIEGPVQVSPQSTELRLKGRESAIVDITATVPRSVTGGEFDLTVKFDDETATATVTVPELENTNLARFGTAAASSSNSDFPASQAIDGNADSSDWEQGTGWNDNISSEFPDWLEVSFPVPLTVDSVDMFTLDSEQFPASEYGLRDYDVQVLVDGEYRTVAEVRDNTRGYVRSTFSEIRAEAVRLLIHDTNDGNYSRVIELEVYNNS